MRALKKNTWPFHLLLFALTSAMCAHEHGSCCHSESGVGFSSGLPRGGIGGTNFFQSKSIGGGTPPSAPPVCLLGSGLFRSLKSYLVIFFLSLMMLDSSQNNEIIREQQVNSLSVDRLQQVASSQFSMHFIIAYKRWGRKMSSCIYFAVTRPPLPSPTTVLKGRCSWLASSVVLGGTVELLSHYPYWVFLLQVGPERQGS